MGIRIDGTDDVQLTVTVLDAQGKEISNSPEVTLKLVAGPGEFPTGTSITFKQDSDIRIQDGKAAIAFVRIMPERPLSRLLLRDWFRHVWTGV